MTEMQDIKEETPNVPACCRTCGNHQPQFFTVYGKECAAFGTTKGVKNDSCGAWCKKIRTPKYG